MTSPNGTAGVGKWIVEKLSHGSRKPVHTTFSLSGEETCFTLCHTMVPFAVYGHLSSLSKALTPGSKLATFISHEGTVIFLFFPTLPLHCTVPQAKKHRKKNIWKESVFTWCCAERNKAEVQLWRRRAHHFARIRYKIKNRINWATNLDWCLVGGEVEEDGLLA